MIRDIPGLLRKMSEALRAFTEVAVVGMSGGADSTLVSVLCTQFLGKSKVYGVHMPAVAEDFKTFNRNSLNVASRLGIHSLLLPVGDVTSTFNKALSSAMGKGVSLSRVNLGNTRARLRMAGLYGVAHHLSGQLCGKSVRVIGTGNLSEDFIGYDTKGGDALADFFLIGSLFKSEVYQLLDYFRDQGVLSEGMIDRIPSAGLWQGQTDESELGYSYNEMEVSVRKLLSGQRPGPDATGCDHFVYQRHIQHKHKHDAPPVLEIREFCDG